MKRLHAEDVSAKLAAYVASFPTKAEAAEALGVSPQLLNDMLRGRRTIGAGVLAALGLRRVELFEEVRT